MVDARSSASPPWLVGENCVNGDVDVSKQSSRQQSVFERHHDRVPASNRELSSTRHIRRVETDTSIALLISLQPEDQ